VNCLDAFDMKSLSNCVIVAMFDHRLATVIEQVIVLRVNFTIALASVACAMSNLATSKTFMWVDLGSIVLE
jgi:hypothetical protein